MDEGKKVPEKKRYSSPILWVHGGIGELTQTGMHTGLQKDSRGAAMDLRSV